jgi:hypothetical protein
MVMTNAAAPARGLQLFTGGPSTTVGWTDMAGNHNTFRIDSITGCGMWANLGTMIFTVHTTFTAIGPSIAGRQTTHNTVIGVGEKRFWAAGDPTIKGLLIATLQAEKGIPRLMYKVSGIYEVGASPSRAETLQLRAKAVATCPAP